MVKENHVELTGEDGTVVRMCKCPVCDKELKTQKSASHLASSIIRQGDEQKNGQKHKRTFYIATFPSHIQNVHVKKKRFKCTEDNCSYSTE